MTATLYQPSEAQRNTGDRGQETRRTSPRWPRWRNPAKVSAPCSVAGSTLPSRWHSPRRGLTLTEVLVATFVGVIGILSLAALLPVGIVQITQTVRADVGSSVARSAWRTIRAHDLISYAHEGRVGSDPIPRYFHVNGNPIQINDPASGEQIATTPLSANNTQGAYVIDPFGLAFSSGVARMGVFPCLQAGDPVDNNRGIPRVTLRRPVPTSRPDLVTSLSGTQHMMGLPGTPGWGPLAVQMFTGNVDPVFGEVSEETGLPPRVFAKDGRPAIEGKFSWMVTVNPINAVNSTAEERFWGRLNPLCTVSVAVFENRFPAPGQVYSRETEGRVYVAFPPGGGIGGGEVRIAWDGGDPDAIAKIRPGDWIMLYQFVEWEDWDRWVAKWYEVVAIDSGPREASQFNFPDPVSTFLANNYQLAAPGAGGNLPEPVWFRSVSLRGPDWDARPPQIWNGSAWVPDPDLTNPVAFEKRIAFGAVCDRVIGVYTKTMRLKQN